MSQIIEVKVPDIGNFSDVPIIEVLVKPGDVIKAEEPLITLESDKATMDVPAPLGGVVQELRVQAGEKVSEGTIILTLSTGESSRASSRARSRLEMIRDGGRPLVGWLDMVFLCEWRAGRA